MNARITIDNENIRICNIGDIGDETVRFVCIEKPENRSDTPIGALTPHLTGITGTAGVMDTTETEE